MQSNGVVVSTTYNTADRRIGSYNILALFTKLLDDNQAPLAKMINLFAEPSIITFKHYQANSTVKDIYSASDMS